MTPAPIGVGKTSKPTQLNLENVSQMGENAIKGTPLPPSSKNAPLKEESLPTLCRPKIAVGSLEGLLRILTREAESSSKEATLTNLLSKAQERDQANLKKQDEIKKNTEQLENKSWWDSFLSVFKVVGAVVGIAAGIALAGVGGVVFLAAGIATAVMSANSALKILTGGKVDVVNSILKFTAKAFGASDEAAEKFAMVCEVGILVATAIAGGVAAWKTLASKAADAAAMAAKIAEAKKTITTVKQLANIAVKTGEGIATIGSAVVELKITQSRATQKEMDALIQKLQEAMAMNQEFYEGLVKRSFQLFSNVTEIVKDKNDAEKAICTAGKPSMA